jgi:hypothetical protein
MATSSLCVLHYCNNKALEAVAVAAPRGGIILSKLHYTTALLRCRIVMMMAACLE